MNTPNTTVPQDNPLAPAATKKPKTTTEAKESTQNPINPEQEAPQSEQPSSLDQSKTTETTESPASAPTDAPLAPNELASQDNPSAPSDVVPNPAAKDTGLEKDRPIADIAREAIALLEKYENGPLACFENATMLRQLHNIVQWDERRTSLRKIQGVEGTQMPHKYMA